MQTQFLLNLFLLASLIVGYYSQSRPNYNFKTLKRIRPTKKTCVKVALFATYRMTNDPKYSRRYVSDIVEAASQTYAWHDIKLKVFYFEEWKYRDKITIYSSNEGILSNFKQYIKSNSISGADAHMLLFNYRIPGNTLGIAYLNTVCKPVGVGIIQAGMVQSYGVFEIGLTFAHELGHILGMEHVKPNECYCAHPNNKCVMNWSTYLWEEDFPSQFHQCSIERLNTQTRNCLFDCSKFDTLPNKFPNCGDGLMEGSETCDCGFEENCINSGQTNCNLDTCRKRVADKPDTNITPDDDDEDTLDINIRFTPFYFRRNVICYKIESQNTERQEELNQMIYLARMNQYIVFAIMTALSVLATTITIFVKR